jgi:hypothetical protein
MSVADFWRHGFFYALKADVMDYICVRNWYSFQHYKDRNPPWIKLYNELLDDYEFDSLPDSAKGHLVCIWMLASRLDNKIPYKPLWIAKKIGANSNVDITALIEMGFLKEWSIDTDEANQWDSRYISKELRAKILKKYKNKCVLCDSKLMPEIDHIVPISKGGKSEEDNLQLLCRGCNRKKNNALPQDLTSKRSNLLQETDSKCDPEKSKVKKRREEKIKTKKPLGFNSVPESSFKKLFSDELDPLTQFEINTLNKYATKCCHKQDDLPNVYTYLIEEIADLKEHCKVKRKGHDDLMRMFIASIKKEFNIA